MLGLDKKTTQKAHDCFREGTVSKEYLGVLEGVMRGNMTGEGEHQAGVRRREGGGRQGGWQGGRDRW